MAGTAGQGADLDTQLLGLCEAAIRERVFPGCQVGYIRAGKQTVLPVGSLTYEAGAPAVRADTRYDVASVTKSIPTATLLLKLIDQGKAGLGDQIIKYIPELSNAYREQILVRHLLTYTVVFDIPSIAAMAKQDPDNLLKNLLAAPLLAPPGEKYFYTNAPAILMGLVVEDVTGRRLDEVAQDDFFGPLGMTHTAFDGRNLPSEQVAPSEIDERGEVRGEPHDETAWALRRQGMTSGHAGLFTTAGDLLQFCDMIIAGGKHDGMRYLREEMVGQMRANQIPELDARAGLGWEIERPDVMGRAQRPGLLMKSGFTGCWVAIGPDVGNALVLLSNRNYPKRPPREPFQAFMRGLNEEFFGLPAGAH